jgi:protein-tyrosine phosphatase
MAQAIAQDLLMRSPPKGLRVHVDSAGTGAEVGSPPSRETVDALASVGAEPTRHLAQQVTKSMLESATAVYAMTNAHRRVLTSLAPDLASKIHLLDPQGKDVADPIGRGTEVYRHTAATLREMVSQRLQEVLAAQASGGQS